MKKFFRFFLLSTLVLSAAGFVGCGEDAPVNNNGGGEDPQPSTKASLEILSVEADYMEAKAILKSSNCTEYAWKLLSPDQPMTETLTVFFATAEAKGQTATLADGNTTLSLDGLSPDTEYVLYVAAKTNKGAFYKDILSKEFKTKGVGATEEGLTYIAPSYEGFSVYVNVPQTVIDAKNMLRWQVVDAFTYYTHTIAMQRSDAFALLSNGGNKSVGEDTMLVLDNYTAYERDENGNVIYYETDDGELVPAQVFDEIVPGQLSYFLIGEFEWAKEGEVLGLPAGYNIYLFNEYDWYMAGSLTDYESQKQYWTGYYERHIYEAKKPELLEAKSVITIDNERANDARITITPEEGVQVYCYWIVPNSLYLQVSDILNADGDSDVDEDWQWFITSYAAVFEGAKQSPDQNNDGKPDAVQFQLSDSFYEEAAPTPGVPYHIFVTSIADSGKKQSFSHEVLVLPDYTLPKPEVVVTPVPEKTTESVVCFNVKVTNGVGYTAKYFCDSEKNWSDAMGQGYRAEDLLNSYGAYFAPEDVAKMNTPEGYDVVIGEDAPFSYDELARIVVRVTNAEGQSNDINDAMAEVRTKNEPAKEPVDDAYINRMLGDWTISAEVMTSDGKSWVKQSEPVVSTVSIMNEITYSEELFEEFLKGFMSVQKDEQRGYWAEYKAEADRINLNLKNQNRLLCVGFDLFHPDNAFKGALDVAMPWDLFTSKTYSCVVTTDVFKDFGPKWYIDIAQDGSMVMPMNINVFGSLSDWYDDYTYYMIAWNSDHNYYLYNNPATNGYLNFPVEISADGNTVTISPVEVDGLTYYPTPVVDYYGQIQAESIVASKITLTRNSGAALLSTPSAGNRSLTSVEGVGQQLPDLKAKRCYSRSLLPENLKPMVKPYITKVKVSAPSSMEEIIENTRNRMK